jgi:hypothetical protein
MSDGYLAGYFAGQDAERERIIKLLQEESGSYPVGWNYTDWIIALIEGEEK